MPELPELETIRRELAPAIVGLRVMSVRIDRRDIVEQPGSAPQKPGKVRLADQLLEGTKVMELRRHGKRLAILTDTPRCLEIHLGMSGQLLLYAQGNPVPRLSHAHARWVFDSGDQLIFRDPRRFGFLCPWPDRAVLQASWNELGPDALSIDGPTLRRRLGSSTRAIKAALLDQSVLAGVGNIYADESLFLARLNPAKVAGSLTARQGIKLAEAIQTVLKTSLERKGSTLRDYRTISGETGQAQDGHWVYGRMKQPCRVCGATLAHGLFAQRTTVWCPVCQAQ